MTTERRTRIGCLLTDLALYYAARPALHRTRAHVCAVVARRML